MISRSLSSGLPDWLLQVFVVVALVALVLKLIFLVRKHWDEQRIEKRKNHVRSICKEHGFEPSEEALDGVVRMIWGQRRSK
jgi:uncharacterized protein YneF (UPF0154 family)